MARKLIEKYRRRPEVDLEGCIPVKLSDGQEWYFPRPWLEIVPRFVSGRAELAGKVLTCGPDLDVLVESIATTEDTIGRLIEIMTLGAFLLLRNYDVTDEELSRLFVYRSGSPDSDRMIMDILAVATGDLHGTFGGRAIIGPKASAVGCA